MSWVNGATYVEQIHGENLPPHFFVVVGVDPSSPVGRDSFASVPDILAVACFVRAEERHHRLGKSDGAYNLDFQLVLTASSAVPPAVGNSS